jgi:hypothetical protein
MEFQIKWLNDDKPDNIEAELRFVRAAAKIEEYFSVDELERFAEKIRNDKKEMGK